MTAAARQARFRRRQRENLSVLGIEVRLEEVAKALQALGMSDRDTADDAKVSQALSTVIEAWWIEVIEKNP